MWVASRQNYCQRIIASPLGKHVSAKLSLSFGKIFCWRQCVFHSFYQCSLTCISQSSNFLWLLPTQSKFASGIRLLSMQIFTASINSVGKCVVCCREFVTRNTWRHFLQKYMAQPLQKQLAPPSTKNTWLHIYEGTWLAVDLVMAPPRPPKGLAIPPR